MTICVQIYPSHPLIDNISFSTWDHLNTGPMNGMIIMQGPYSLMDGTEKSLKSRYELFKVAVDHMLMSVANVPTAEMRRRVELSNIENLQDYTPVFRVRPEFGSLNIGYFANEHMPAMAGKFMHELRATGLVSDDEYHFHRREMARFGLVIADPLSLVDFNHDDLYLVSKTGKPGPVKALLAKNCEKACGAKVSKYYMPARNDGKTKHFTYLQDKKYAA